MSAPGCPICGKTTVLYWLHTRAQYPNIPGKGTRIRLLSKEHAAACPQYGCHDCGVYGKPTAVTEGGAADIWKRRIFE